MKEKNGGSAFPVSFTFAHGDESIFLSGGMTLRDYFADGANRSGTCPHNQHDHAKCAEWAYDRADAMLAAREAKS